MIMMLLHGDVLDLEPHYTETILPHVLPVESKCRTNNHCLYRHGLIAAHHQVYLNRRILMAATVRNGNMVLLVCVCSETYWANTENDLNKAVAASFRLKL